MNEKGAAKILIRPKITQTKEKERRKIGREEKKRDGYTLTFYIGYVGDGF